MSRCIVDGENLGSWVITATPCRGRVGPESRGSATHDPEGTLHITVRCTPRREKSIRRRGQAIGLWNARRAPLAEVVAHCLIESIKSKLAGRKGKFPI